MKRKAIKSRWIRLPDRLFRHVWRCPDCRAVAEVGPDYYEESGTPLCGECERDYVYIRTEFDLGAYLARCWRRLLRRSHKTDNHG